MQFKNKLRLLTLAAIVVGVLLGLFWAVPTAAKAPQQSNSENYISEDIIIKDNAIQPRHILSSSPIPKRNNGSISGRNYSGKTYTKEEVIQLIKDYSVRYGINSDLPLRIAKCESGYNHLAKNKTSSASGTFQYLSSTWAGTDEGRVGLSVFDADANVRAAIKYIASRGHASPWLASKGCWG